MHAAEALNGEPGASFLTYFFLSNAFRRLGILFGFTDALCTSAGCSVALKSSRLKSGALTSTSSLFSWPFQGDHRDLLQCQGGQRCGEPRHWDRPRVHGGRVPPSEHDAHNP